MKSLARLGESVSSPPTGASDGATLTVMIPIIGTGCDTKRACPLPAESSMPIRENKSLAALDAPTSIQYLPFTDWGRPRFGEGKASVFPDLKRLRSLRQPPGQGPAFLVRVEENPERARDSGLMLPRGFSRFGAVSELRENQSGGRENQSQVRLVRRAYAVYFSIHAEGACPGGAGPARTGTMRVGPDNRRSGYPG